MIIVQGDRDKVKDPQAFDLPQKRLCDHTKMALPVMDNAIFPMFLTFSVFSKLRRIGKPVIRGAQYRSGSVLTLPPLPLRA